MRCQDQVVTAPARVHGPARFRGSRIAISPACGAVAGLRAARVALLSATLAACLVPAAFAGNSSGWAQGAGDWNASVQIDGRTIVISAVSKSGDATEDDMEITIAQDDARVPVPVRRALYEPAEVSSDQKMYAENLPVFKVGPHALLLVLTENARPAYPYATLVAYDYLSRKVTDVRERIASFKQEVPFQSRYAVMSFGSGRYRLRLIKDRLDTGSDGAETYIEGWMTVRVVRGKLECAWQ